MKTFGKYARERLRELGKSQKSLAEELGVSPAYISQIFSGKKSPPDLGRPRNRVQLRLWSTCLQTPEEDLLEVVRFELHRLPPRPDPRFRNMRDLLIRTLAPAEKPLIDEIRSLELHPAESRAIRALARIFLALGRQKGEVQESMTAAAHSPDWQALRDRDFVEETLVGFFEKHSFMWTWDPLGNDVHLESRSAPIFKAMARLEKSACTNRGLRQSPVVPVVGKVSAGEGFDHPSAIHSRNRFEDLVVLPAGTDPGLAQALYCVRVRDDSLRELFGEGALLFVKADSSAEIKDGDVVIFRDENEGKGYVKKVEFTGDLLILKARNPLYRDIVLRYSDMRLLERVISVAF